MNVVIVLPTYNERESIESTINGIEEVIPKIKKHKFSILVVDDNSPDGTSEVVKQISKKFKNVFLLSGEKKGIGWAYIRGFKYAMKNMKADVLFEMDADGQHDPKILPNFMKK